MSALVELPASANLTDVIFSRAHAEPGAVVLRRPTPGGGWQDVTATAGGINVAPAVLEDRIRAHPLVSQCTVVGRAVRTSPAW